LIIGGAVVAVIIVVIILIVANSGIGRSGGQVTVNRVSEYSFTPNRTGMWRFETSNNFDCDPYLELLDSFGRRIAWDDDGAGSYNALIIYPLEAGVRYTIRARYYSDYDFGRYTLTVSYQGFSW